MTLLIKMNEFRREQVFLLIYHNCFSFYSTKRKKATPNKLGSSQTTTRHQQRPRHPTPHICQLQPNHWPWPSWAARPGQPGYSRAFLATPSGRWPGGRARSWMSKPRAVWRPSPADMGHWVIGNCKLIESTTITNYIW